MSKLFVVVLAFSTVSLVVGDEALRRELFFDIPVIKLLTSPGLEGAYPGDDTKYDVLFKALAALQEPITVEEVKEVLKGHAPKLLKWANAVEDAFVRVRDSVENSEAKNFLTQYFKLLEQYYLVGTSILDQAKECQGIRKRYRELSYEAKKQAGAKLKVALDAVVKALNTPPL